MLYEIEQISFDVYILLIGPPGGSAVENPPAMPETRVQSLSREDPLEEGIATFSNILAWRISWTEDLVGNHRVTKSQTQLEQLSTHASSLFILWTVSLPLLTHPSASFLASYRYLSFNIQIGFPKEP